MEENDPRRPLLGTQRENRYRRVASKLCSLDSWRRRLPITIWLPNYCVEYLIRDVIAGVTVGLTSIPQGIAYAIVAGVPPQVGLYSSIFPGIVYAMFGSCKVVTVGPTAILSALLAKYVARSEDFAYLAAFLSGCCVLLLGVLQLGFLLDFISKPVISGFTTAAALQIAASQLKSLFRISGKSGDTFVSALVNFFKNITTVHLWDPILGIASIIALIILKKSAVPVSDTDSPFRRKALKTWQYLVQARNAIVVLVAAIIAFVLHLYGRTPFALIGTIHGGLPHFGPPPFTTTVHNQTVDFEGMLGVFGPEGLVMPLVAILESIAIAKAFAGSTTVDATQEMIAIGMCNLLASFAQSMPATGSFTRTAINHASGVMTPAGSLVKAGLVLLSVTLLTEAFYFIPRATLAGIIIMAMVSLIELDVVRKLWRNSKLQLVVYAVTVTTGACAGLEYGILAGACVDVLRALAAAARPPISTHTFKVGNQDCICLIPVGDLSYASAEYIPNVLRKHAQTRATLIVFDAKHLNSLDIGVAENLISVILDLEVTCHRFLIWNLSKPLTKLLEDIHPGFGSRCVTGPSIDQHILGLDVIGREPVY
ncbi:sodium-independent sulfate anion transporter-like isoform X2 [Ostrinia furnacalis]|uniref:sodium-independent sulfate anion transporter-like isoform X2 n=1 Tax=Ostrinia furnacalis TaxID=93504 RepID=UPI00103F37D8|nr:sodium-independent sulfate anion transporter-like isoform X2 [Ostrinia furnacalis]